MKILIVEDDKEISKLLNNFLSESGYEVTCAYNGKEATTRWKEDAPDLILMDLMLPMKSGEKLIREIREESKVPIIVISAKSAMEARLEVLRTGADDYILKPFDLNEVLVRIQVVLRRLVPMEESGKGEGSSEAVELCVGDLRVSPSDNAAYFKNQPVALTAKEFQILLLLIRNPQKVFTKANLYESVWNDTYYYEDNTINVHVSNLRSKLKKASGIDFVETVWGIGYRLRALTSEG